VRERPVDISDSDVAVALARQWALTVQDLSYLPVGFGGYHWLAADQTGSRWFVTVSDLATPWVPDLPAAMQTAAWLATQAGLDFVVAPMPTRAGQVVGSVDSRHAVTLFPYLDAAPSHFEDPIDDDDRAVIIDMLARLHTAIPQGIQVPTQALQLTNRQAIDQALASLGVPWNGGPYAEPGRDLLARYERPLRQAFARFDDLLHRVREAGGPYVITHGEPHPGNLLHTRAGLCLVDWDMTALARPERDPLVGDLRRPGRRTVLVADWLDGQPGRAGAVPAALGPGRRGGIPVPDPGAAPADGGHAHVVDGTPEDPGGNHAITQPAAMEATWGVPRIKRTRCVTHQVELSTAE
jgi:spectinomycin phosphotransferase